MALPCNMHDVQLCAVRTLLKALQCSGAVHDSDSLFAYKKGSERIVMLHSVFKTMLRNTIHSIGLSPVRYSSHSLRRGGATSTFSSGVPA